ncbi:diguanylate cyclase/phosphodiesterase (GGDEF & EAL domains) with PAS/PAC sensor(s) [hydrothermal vent metagenome]|uniref:Diguanylate cyclase/phosphodiesterase (GGDEF & EAL domains) with PAS/PAC sensor(S) n=1 Tax=hydrothermal vent metagenome TaxID=652676 RepID=A0A3B0U852_9ZZZZ
MNFGEIIRTKRWKVFMGYVYGWGASIVMIGALFKLEHLPYSGYILAVGLLTESFIFFLSAFEPPLEMPDWGKVYPELREDYEIIDFDDLNQGDDSNKLNELLSSSDITPELISKVSKGLNDLSNTARGISDISTATLATELYVKNLSSASEAMSMFAETNINANNSINSSVDQLANSYVNTAQLLSDSGQGLVSELHKTGAEFSEKLAESGELLSKSYQEVSNYITSDLQKVGLNSKEYSSNLEQLNKNIAAFNSTFETQLKGTEEQFQAVQKFSSGLSRINQVLSASAEEIKKYKENAEQLNKHLEALNTIYGGMLGAMNYKK